MTEHSALSPRNAVAQLTPHPQTLAPVAHSNGSPGASRRTGTVPAASARTSGSVRASLTDAVTPKVAFYTILFYYMIKGALILLIKR